MCGRRYSSTRGVPLPFETNPVTRPCARASLKIATAHSDVMSGSLYVDTTIFAPWRSASCTSDAGVVSCGGAIARGSRNACDVTQFWQYEQCRSQPGIPKLYASAPG